MRLARSLCRAYYQDVTWGFKNMDCYEFWKSKVPSRKGEHSIHFRIGCAETVFLKDCILLFRGSKANKSSDYQTEMAWEFFSSWYERNVFPQLRTNNVQTLVVWDKATYHTVLDEDVWFSSNFMEQKEENQSNDDMERLTGWLGADMENTKNKISIAPECLKNLPQTKVQNSKNC